MTNRRKDITMANVQQPLLDYFQNNPDRPITLDELDKQLKPLNRTQIANGIHGLKNSGSYPQLIVLSRGVYQWNGAEPEPDMTNEMLVSVVKVRDDGKMLVRDDSTGILYVMCEFEF